MRLRTRKRWMFVEDGLRDRRQMHRDG
jgi:hypothetical protein